MSEGAGFGAWLDNRTGYSTLVRLILDEPIPGGARWWYTFGAVLTFLLGVEMLTGVLLATVYAPAATSAWASTAYIQDTLPLGWFVRGLHNFGSSAMLALAGVHLLQVLTFGAYKAPREMNWLVGLILLALLLAFALSGQGLPWDENGYWAKQVEVGILGSAPLVGPGLQRLVQGGATFGTVTVTHFYALHVLLLPATIAVALVVHVALVRKHGLTPRWGRDEAALARATQAYWPHQALRDTTVSGMVLIGLALLVIRNHGADLAGPADPNASIQARPEWYVLPLFALRMLLGGALENVATLLVPALAAMTLGALPWLDRARSRDPGRRPLVMLGALVGLAGLGVLASVPLRAERADRGLQAARVEMAARARLARTLAKDGVLPEGGLAVYRNDPSYAARELFREHCGTCHGFSGEPSGKEGPDLKDYNSRAWIERFLRNPDSPLHMGGAKIEDGMRPVRGSDTEIRQLAELIYAESGAPDVDRAAVAAAEPLFSEKDCDSCHERDGQSANVGPNLKGRGTLAYLVDLIADPSEPRLFGKKNKMPRFAGKLTPEEIGELARFVLAESRR
jgi:ubiquinol-cytochrome c reductase cytochrome b subunit